ncbi:MAG: hypothetical protein WCK98_05745 [bacterium]
MKHHPVIIKSILAFTLLAQVLVSFSVTAFAANKAPVLLATLNSLDKKDGSGSSDPKAAVYSAGFGYTNLTSNPITVPAGSDNFLAPVDISTGSNVVETFKPGTQVNTFRVDLKCDQFVTWSIKGPNSTTQSASAKAPSCDSVSAKPEDNVASCTNPVGWEEDISRGDNNNKFFWVPKNSAVALPKGASHAKNPELFNTMLCSYTDKVKYKDSEGKFKNIDNTIKELDSNDSKRKNEGYKFVNTGNDFKAYFPANPNQGWKFENDQGVKVTILKVTIAGGGLNFNVNSVKIDGSSIIYSEVLPNVDLQYKVDNDGVSKAFILKNKEAIKNDLSKIEFTLDTGDKKLSKSNTLDAAINDDVDKDLTSKNKKNLTKKATNSEEITAGDVQDQIDSLAKTKTKIDSGISTKSQKVKDLVKAAATGDAKKLEDPKSGVKSLTASQQQEFNDALLENQKGDLVAGKQQALKDLKDKFSKGKVDSKNKAKVQDEIDKINNIADTQDSLALSGATDLKVAAPFSYEAGSSSNSTSQVSGIKADSFKISSDGKTYTIYPDQSYLSDSKRQFPVIIDPRLIGGNYTAADSFYNQRDPNSPRGSNNSFHLAVGGYPCINNGTAYCYPLWSTRTAITFNIPAEARVAANVVWANFRLRQYSTYGGGFRMNIFNACGFNEWGVTWNSQPCIAEWRGSIWAGNTNCWWEGCGTDDWSSDIGQLVRDNLNGGGRGVNLVIADENENLYRGATFCSKDGWVAGHPCSNGSAYGPYLQVMLNEQPTPPNLESPNSNDEINGKCDLSVSPVTGKCDRLMSLNLRVSNI